MPLQQFLVPSGEQVPGASLHGLYLSFWCLGCMQVWPQFLEPPVSGATAAAAPLVSLPPGDRSQMPSSLRQLRGQPVWLESALRSLSGSSNCPQTLHQSPRRLSLMLKLQALAGTISCSTPKSSSLPPPEERDFGLEAT